MPARRRRLGRQALVYMALLACFGYAEAFAQAVSPCSELLPEAERHYVAGELDAVITVLTPCVASSEISVEEAVSAYRLLSLSYIKRGELEQAKIAVLQLLSHKPDYGPDPVRDLPSYTALVNVVKQQLTLAVAQEPVAVEEREESPRVSPEPVRRRSWFAAHRGWVLAGGSVAVAGIVAAVAAGSSGGGDGGSGGGASALPLPPALPD